MLDAPQQGPRDRSRPRLAGRVAAVLVLASVLPGTVHAACPPSADDGQQLQQGGVLLAWRSVPPPRVGQPFAIIVQLCPEGAQLLRVDATMPEHRHGMNYRPSLQALGGGRWQVQGLLWHMPGRWELRWDVRSAGPADAPVEVLRASVQLQ